MKGRGPSPEMMKKRFQEADKDDDGLLSREEAPERLQKHFDKIDANDDDQLAPEELKKAIAKLHQQMRAKGTGGPSIHRGRGPRMHRGGPPEHGPGHVLAYRGSGGPGRGGRLDRDA